MKLTNLTLHYVMEMMGDGYSREAAQAMLSLIQNEKIEDTHDITDARWAELCAQAQGAFTAAQRMP